MPPGHYSWTVESFQYQAALLTALALMALCSCSTREPARPAILREASFNAEAGRGDYLNLKLHLENEGDFDFLVDTGCPTTTLKKDLEPKLGKRVGMAVALWSQGRSTNGLYEAPKLCLEGAPLASDLVVACGSQCILGTDVLKHYCVQLDFTSNVVRFLDSDRLKRKDLGMAFPLKIDGDHVVVKMKLLGVSHWVVDTGTPFDAAMRTGEFAKASKGQPIAPIVISKRTIPEFGACFSRATLRGHTYSDLYIAEEPVGSPFPNLIGLAFLARNLVTFDFPKRVMYLRQVTAQGLNFGGILTLEARTYLDNLAGKGQLPGFATRDNEIDWIAGDEDSTEYPVARTFEFQISGSSDVRHYVVVRPSKTSPWKVQKAWRTDANKRTVEEYPTFGGAPQHAD